jgi:hypothetical protein
MSAFGANVRTVTPTIVARPSASAAVRLVARLGTDPSNVAAALASAVGSHPPTGRLIDISPSGIVVLSAILSARPWPPTTT